MKPLLSELKVGMSVWLPAKLVGKAEGFSYTQTYKKKWQRGEIIKIENTNCGVIITVDNDDWNYTYDFNYTKDCYGIDWTIFNSKGAQQ